MTCCIKCIVCTGGGTAFSRSAFVSFIFGCFQRINVGKVVCLFACLLAAAFWPKNKGKPQGNCSV